jgi:hypothetical protein
VGCGVTGVVLRRGGGRGGEAAAGAGGEMVHCVVEFVIFGACCVFLLFGVDVESVVLKVFC